MDVPLRPPVCKFVQIPVSDGKPLFAKLTECPIEPAQQLDLFADRTSCSLWRSNRSRMLTGGLAHVLPEQIRRHGLYGTRLARAHVGTLRLKLLRIGAVIVRNTRRVVFMLSGSCPYQNLFRLAVQRLAP